MNGIDNPIIFYSATFLMLLFAVLTLWFKNIFHSLVSSIFVFFIAGFFFYILGSEYNAVIQLAIYGIAVPVILGIAVMFTSFKNNTVTEKEQKKTPYYKYIAILALSLFALSLVYLIMISFSLVPSGFNTVETLNSGKLNSISAFGTGLFVNYVWAFELVSIILTIIVAGFTMFKGGTKWVK